MYCFLVRIVIVSANQFSVAVLKFDLEVRFWHLFER